MWRLIAASSRSERASAARACEDWVSGAALAAEIAGVSFLVSGNRSRTMMSFMCGRWEVATARSVGSVGHSARQEGLNAIQAFACGARFCLPASLIDIEPDSVSSIK